jgi:RNase adapter protein RapZ
MVRSNSSLHREVDGNEGDRKHGHIVILSGISGAGKTTAMKAFEDIGFDAIDNPPFAVLPTLLNQPPAEKLVIGVDARTRGLDVEMLLSARSRFAAASGAALSLVYLDCEEEVALRRFKETRRRHPLSADGSPREGLVIEREMLNSLRKEADYVLDTSIMSPRELKRWVQGIFGAEDPAGLIVQLVSFSYRQGIPREADLMFDVRFLVNPHYDEELRPKSGLDPEVAAYVESDPGTAKLLGSLSDLFDFCLPRYEQEGKSYLTIAIGCTGGRHRSVYVTEKLAAHFVAHGWSVQVMHRDIERERLAQAAV